MQKAIDDLKINSLKELLTPEEVMSRAPISSDDLLIVKKTREQIRNIIQGRDKRLLVIVGPCSIHSYKTAIEYATRLKGVIEKFKNELCIVMRVYFEKPRTCVGWKGFINDPHLDETFDINTGLVTARELLVSLNQMGVPASTEFLDTISPQFISDLICWGAIGARTTECQIHRELASGISSPIGFKNRTDGNIDIAIDAIRAASFPHHFLGVTKNGRAAIVNTTGNNDGHIILRGSNCSTNFDRKSIADVVAKLNKSGLNPHVMVDCSHGNSSKQHEKQVLVAEDICHQLNNEHSSVADAICGVMLESHLVGGSQPFKVGQKPAENQSITDACLSWEETELVLEKLAAAANNRLSRESMAFEAE